MSNTSPSDSPVPARNAVPGRRTVLQAAAWTTPVVVAAIGAPLAAASAPVTVRTVAFVDQEGGDATTSYTTSSCNPFNAYLQVSDSGVPAAAGIAVTVTLPTALRWYDGTATPRTLFTGAGGSLLLEGFNGLRFATAGVSQTGTITATTAGVVNPAQPTVPVADATTAAIVNGTSGTRTSTFRGRRNNVESEMPEAVTTVVDFAVAWTGVGDTAASATYLSYVVSQNGDVYSHTAPSGGFYEWDTTTPIRIGMTSIAADDGLIIAGGDRGARLFSASGSTVYDWDGVALAAAPGGRTVLDIAVSFSDDSLWRVSLVATDGTAWEATKTIEAGASWSPWTQVLATVTGLRQVAADTQVFGATRRIFATTAAVFDQDGTQLTALPAGRTAKDLGVEIGGNWINVIGDNNQYYRTPLSNPGTWDSNSTGSPVVTITNVTSVASASTPNIGIRAFYVAGAALCG
ncbi:hypothetical protein [Rathayibacter sp. AY1F6]|uniref:hypothetical protein n=1 Tax=Rathayibacter sp. AY1F6 TaxID=2080560 RepID=UPI0011B0E46C|nr:hypothetical protein [Rathayibacter sp. AY1F6]